MRYDKDDIITQNIMKQIMREMQKDFYNEKWWLDDKKDKLPLIMGIWEFKEEAIELGFTIGMSQKQCHNDGAFNRETADPVFIEGALTCS